MFDQLTDELLELEVDETGYGNAQYAVIALCENCSSSTIVLCCSTAQGPGQN